MATVTLETTLIRKLLSDLSKKVDDATNWLPKRKEITLEIPEPYDHLIQAAPHSRKPCLAPPICDECADIGILLGILDAMKKPARKAREARPTKRPRP